MKRVLITGANSYLGTSIEQWLKRFNNDYHVEVLDMINESWKDFDFSSFDCVFHVAGIAHDINKKTAADLYKRINTDLAEETAKIAKLAGVKHFIFMSSILVYSDVKAKVITKDTVPCAKRPYPASKLKAEELLNELNDDTFVVSNVRPPMIFGQGCKGNFPRLVKLATKLPIFPKIKNKRSMIHITNFVEFIRLLIDNPVAGALFPQNERYFATYEIVRIIAKEKGKRVYCPRIFNWLIKLVMPIVPSLKKLFGSLTYDLDISNPFDENYCIISNEECIKKSL